MGTKSKIEWTETTWNPITGCTKISSGCKHCYAERMARRLHAMGSKRYLNGFNLTVHEDLFEAPLHWKKPRHIFVNSMSDLFHENLDFQTIKSIFDTMNKAQHHTFQVLTKRSEVLQEFAPYLEWGSNIWMGVTVESNEYLSRISDLKSIPAKTKFISFEPLLSDIRDVNFSGIDWVIVGGESGPGARPMEEEWVLSIKEMCTAQQTAFFFKQWGGVNKKKAGRILKGRTWNEYPRYAVV